MHLRNLATFQNWDCHSCSNCCREYAVPVTEAERRRIEAQGWDKDAELAGQRFWKRHGPWWGRRYRLAHRREGGCVFLGPDNRCRIHTRFGAEAKPLACQLFPFVLVPAGDHWRVSLRFACPSAAAGKGQPLAAHRPELERLARLLEQQEREAVTTTPVPLLQRGQKVDWRDVFRFVEAVMGLLRNRDEPVERRWRKCLALSGLCRQAQFDKLSGGKLTEFLALVSNALADEAPADLEAVPRPTWIGRMLFRQEAAIYARKDHGEARGPATRRPLARLGIGCRFALGKGRVPRVNALLRPGVTFADLEKPVGPLPAVAEEMLEKYYLVKVGSLQFCGPTGFGLSLWDGLDTLALTLPLVLWLARGLDAGSRLEAVTRAISIVDDHFGFNRILRTRRHRLAVRLLAGRGELSRLIAWYSR
jgi:lysine-N-methylase